MANKFSVAIEFIASSNMESIAAAQAASMERIRNSASNLNDVMDQNRAKFEKLDRQLTRVARMMSLVVAGAVGASVNEFNKFDAALQDLSALTGLEGDALQYLGDEALRLGKIYGDSAASIIVSNKRVGSNLSELLPFPDLLSKVTEESLILARAQSMPVVDAIEAVTLSMNQYKLTADDTRMMIDTFAAGAKLGAAELNVVSETFAKAGVVLSEANIDFTESNAIIQVLSKNALIGAWAGTQLRSAILSLTSKGIDQFNPKVVGLNQALENLAKAELSSEEKLALFGKEAITAAEIMIRDRALIAEWTEAFKEQGIAIEQASKNLNTNKVRLAQMRVSAQNAAITLGMKLQPATLAVIDGLTGMFNWMEKYSGATLGFISVIGLAALGLTAFIVPAKILMSLKLAKEIYTLTAAMWGLDAALLANPVGLIIAGIIAAIALLSYVLYKYWDIVKPALVDIWIKARDAFEPTIMTLIDLFKVWWEVVGPILMFIGKMVGTVLVSAFFGLLEVVKFVLNHMIMMFKPIAWLFEKIQDLLNLRKKMVDDQKQISMDNSTEFFSTSVFDGMGGGIISSNSPQNVDIFMSIDAEGRPAIKSVESSKAVNFEIDLGNMVPAF